MGVVQPETRPGEVLIQSKLGPHQLRAGGVRRLPVVPVRENEPVVFAGRHVDRLGLVGELHRVPAGAATCDGGGNRAGDLRRHTFLRRRQAVVERHPRLAELLLERAGRHLERAGRGVAPESVPAQLGVLSDGKPDRVRLRLGDVVQRAAIGHDGRATQDDVGVGAGRRVLGLPAEHGQRAVAGQGRKRVRLRARRVPEEERGGCEPGEHRPAGPNGGACPLLLLSSGDSQWGRAVASRDPGHDPG
jgi:hypothetical protein